MTINLNVFISGRNNRILQLTGDLSSNITKIQVLRSFSPVNSQRQDDGKLYGSNDDPLFRVYIDDPYSESNRLGNDDDDWEILGYMDDGSCIYVDNERLPWNKSRDVYYKMRIYTDDSFIDTDIVPAGRFSDKTILPYINGLKKALETEIKESGRKGFLLKAKHWGKKCRKCSDFGVGRSINDHCPHCFGTGFDGGYYEALPLDIIDSAPQTMQARTAEDYVDSEVLSARCMANPVILRGDIWVSTNTNDRYMIDQAVPTSLYKGIPVVLTLNLKKLAQSDVIYEKTVDDTIEESYVNWETIGK